jgi:lipoprotein NlpI
MQNEDNIFQEKLSETIYNLTQKISGCRENEKIRKTFLEINRSIIDLLNFSLDEIVNLPLSQVISRIRQFYNVNNQNLDGLADLFFHCGKAYTSLHQKEMAKRIFSRSLTIYKYLLHAEMDFPYERHLRIKELGEILLQ